MGKFDYLRTIPNDAWVKGTMQCVEEFKQLNSAIKDLDYFGGFISSITPVRFGQWFFSQNANQRTSVNVMSMNFEPYSGTVPSSYDEWERYAGVSYGVGVPYGDFSSNYFDLKNQKVVAYITYTPLSEYVSANDHCVRAVNTWGSGTVEYIDIGLVNKRFNSVSHFVPEITYNRENKTFKYVVDDTVKSTFNVIRSITYYAVDENGKRTEIKNFAPTIPLDILGINKANRAIYMSNSATEPSGYNLHPPHLSIPYSALCEIKLPLGAGSRNVNTASGKVEDYPFIMGRFKPALSLGNNIGATLYWQPMFLPFIGQKTIITAKDHNFMSMPDTNVMNGQYIVNISNAKTLTSHFKNEYIYIISDETANTDQGMAVNDIIYTNGTKSWIRRNSYADYPYSGTNVFSTFQNIKDIFADWGIYATDSYDEAMYSEIPDIVPSNPSGGDSGVDPDLPTGGGVGENILPDEIPKDDQNRIDDFPVEPPLLTQANLCESYIYNYSSVRQIFNWFCSKGYIENQSELFADKLSAIYGLMLYPFDLVAHDQNHVTATDKTTIVSVSENISGYILGDGYNTILDGGSIEYISYYGNFADWKMCQYSLYVPYGGVVEIPASAVVNRRITVQYALDLMTGKATCVIKSYSLNSHDLGVLVKLIPCQIGHLIPVQSSNYAQREISNTLSAISMGTTAISTIAGTVGNATAGNGTKAVGTAFSGIASLAQQGANMAFNQQLTYCATGALSPSTGLSLPQTPFLSISRSHLAVPSRYKDFGGLPTAYYSTIASVSTGSNFVQCDNVKLDNIRATSDEISEIRALLSDGVYI